MAETTTKTANKKTVAKTVTAEAKPVAKKPTAGKKPAVAKKPPIASAPVTTVKPAAKKVAAKPIAITGEQRYRMVAEAAYYRAEGNQFKSDPLRDWIEAENDIAALLAGNK